jgi:predicted DsbA family dithiol-disulfide isomerase
MKIKIWSDIMCPFCYIGKRNFENALVQFAHSEELEIEWKSFQLDPTIPKMKQRMDVYEYLAKSKGFSIEDSKAMHENVVKMAKNVGLEYNFDRAVVANSFDAHRLIQFAKTKGLGNEMEEVLFASYFTNGLDMSNLDSLIQIGSSIGLSPVELETILNSEDFSKEVQSDSLEAQKIGVRGVPFFVIDNKYAISGAQPSSVFLEALEKAFTS